MNVPRFFVFNSLALLVLFSWLWPVSLGYWQQWDTQAFFYFNGWLAESHFSQLFWAFMNFRLTDIVVFLIMVMPFLIPNWVFSGKSLHRHQMQLFLMMALLILVRYSLSHMIGIERESPTYHLRPAYMLRDLVPFIHAKDKALGTFPGDHAAVIFCWLGYLLMQGKKRWHGLFIGLAVLFSLPRLVSGAHWLSDDLVGGTCVALMTLSLLFYTPISEWFVAKATPLYWALHRKLTPNWYQQWQQAPGN